MSQRLLSITEIWQYLKNLRVNIAVKTKFPEQVQQVDDLLKNDKTGIVSTVYDFMVHSATVPMQIETKNESLNKILQIWQTKILNRNVNIDIPGGLRALSVENYKERWRSSLLALKVTWAEEDFGGANNKWIIPKRMWFLNGGAIETESEGALNTRKFFLKKDKKNNEELKNSINSSIFIRKPFTPWHEDKVTPYLIQRGTIFNALMKSAIVQKQSDVIEAILPIILQLKAGSNELALEGLNPTEEQFKDLKQKIVDAKERFDENGQFGDIIASLRHDVNLDYLIPDLTKILNDTIVKSTDRNLLSSLGLIELQGFSSTRQEAILNPKVLIEEVTDAVLDWVGLLEDVMIEMLNRNKNKHTSLTNADIRVIPGKIKAFITDDLRAMLRSLYDRGIISKQTGVEDIADIDFEVEVERREKEEKRNLQKTMKPPVIQNLEQYSDPDIDNNNLEDQDKKPGTPEADNFNNAILKFYHTARIDKIDVTDNYIRIRQKEPSEFEKDSFRTIVLSEKDGIKAIIGRLKGESNTTVQSYLFDKSKWTVSEAKNWVKKNASLKSNQEVIMAPYDTIDELPENVKNVLPVSAQLLWLRVFNSILKETGDEERAIRGAWSKVKEKYEKSPNSKKWIKKASIEEYESTMSPYTYKFFMDVYTTALDQCDSTDKALKTALAMVEKVSTKNKNGVWVKDKSLTKNQIQALDNSDFVEKVIDIELKEKKLKLIDKLLENE